MMPSSYTSPRRRRSARPSGRFPPQASAWKRPPAYRITAPPQIRSSGRTSSNRARDMTAVSDPSPWYCASCKTSSPLRSSWSVVRTCPSVAVNSRTTVRSAGAMGSPRNAVNTATTSPRSNTGSAVRCWLPRRVRNVWRSSAFSRTTRRTASATSSAASGSAAPASASGSPWVVRHTSRPSAPRSPSSPGSVASASRTPGASATRWSAEMSTDSSARLRSARAPLRRMPEATRSVRPITMARSAAR